MKRPVRAALALVLGASLGWACADPLPVPAYTSWACFAGGEQPGGSCAEVCASLDATCVDQGCAFGGGHYTWLVSTGECESYTNETLTFHETCSATIGPVKSDQFLSCCCDQNGGTSD